MQTQSVSSEEQPLLEQPLPEQSLAQGVPLGLYIHIPFCVRKCRYCDFLSAPASDEVRAAYIRSLNGQIRAFGRSLQAASDSNTSEKNLDVSEENLNIGANASVSAKANTSVKANVSASVKANTSVNANVSASVKANTSSNRNTVSGYVVDSIFIGGGTPSLLSSAQMIELMNTVRESFILSSDVEITAECNPGTVNEEKLRAYKSAGINRLSIGLQSSDNEELALLGRIHTWEDFLETFKCARRVGFDNINIDVMGSLPGQTPASYQKTLENVLALHPEHISAYSLIIEKGTPFFDDYGDEDACRACFGESQSCLGKVDSVGDVSKGDDSKASTRKKSLPSEDEVVQMDELTWKLLAQAGYEHYEISNYALQGRQCRHNLKYWHCGEYLGVGTGAASYIRSDSGLVFPKTAASEANVLSQTALPSDEMSGDFLRLKILNDTTKFSEIDWESPTAIASCFLECEALTRQDEMEEMAFLGLRTKEGVRLADFYTRFGKNFDEVYGNVIKKYTAMGMMHADDTHVALTLNGMEVANWIMADFCG